MANRYAEITSVLDRFWKPGHVYRAMILFDVPSFVKSVRSCGMSECGGKMHGIGIYWTWDRFFALESMPSAMDFTVTVVGIHKMVSWWLMLSFIA